MPFNIPTLEEAREKREANVSSVPPQFAGRKRPAPPSSSAAADAPVMPVNPYARSGAAASKPLVNPYAKAASNASNRSAPAASSTSTSVSRPTSQPTTGRWNRNTAAAYAIGAGGVGGNRPLPPPPPDTDDNPHATFSQAFGDVEDSEHYQREVAAIGGIGGSSRQDKARAEQRAFDAAASAASESSPSEHIPGNISARDQHIALQPHVLHVSTKQRGNAVLNHIRNVPFSYSTMVPDYIFSPNRCALFLSCKYHNLHPKYIHRRISELRTDFDLRVLLCLVDIEDNASTLLALNKLCVINNMTLILAWSNEEAARYLETFKAYESKDASSIQRREQTNFSDQVVDVLCAVRSVNKTDSAQLMSQFGTLRGLMAAPMDELSLCPGIGEKKVRRLYEAFHKPFSSVQARKRRKAKEEAAAKAKKKNDSEEDDT
jgi:DNA excision repair protein ERCC-1